MKQTPILLALAIVAVSIAVQASDDYVDLGYAGHTSKFYNKTYHLKLSKELTDDVVGTLEYNTTYADWRDPGEHEEFTTHTFLFDIYKLFPLNDNAEAFVGAGYNSSFSKFNCISGCVNSSYTNQKPEGTALEGSLGLRYVAENGIAISGQYTAINDLNGTFWTSNSSHEVDLSYPVLEDVKIGLRHRVYKASGGGDLDFTALYLRYSY